MDFQDDERLIQHAHLVKQIRAQLILQTEKIRSDAFAARDAAMRQRADAINRVRESLHETTKQIHEKQEAVSHKLNQEAIHRDAHIRVNRGLDALANFIHLLKESDLDAELLEQAIHDPIISRSLKSETRKVISSDFFTSIHQQLIMKTEFINIAAHELKTPIMPILINTEILEEELGDKYEEIRIIARNARRLQRLTENVLNVAKIESGTLRLNKEYFELNEVIGNLIGEEALRLENKKIHLHQNSNNDSIYVYADKDRVVQVISNLLHNALKFTEEGTITITSEITNQEGIVNIQDVGSGIAPTIQPFLFSKFATKSVKGTGLGLYISKNIVEAHGGQIWAKNNTGGISGATFGFSLPLANSQN